MIEKIKNQINQKLIGSKFWYVSNEVEHSLGLVGLVEKLNIVCMSDDGYVQYLKDRGVEVRFPDFLMHSSSDLLLWSGMASGDYVQTFKISARFEEIAKTNLLNLMNTSANLNPLFETKISQAKMFQKAGIGMPDLLTAKLKEVEFENLKSKFGLPFVLQFNRGHTGNGTLFVDLKQEFEKIQQKFPNRDVKIAKKVTGQTYSVNCCKTRNGILIGGIYRQITGLSGLTSKPGGTVGGDFNHGLSESIRVKIMSELKKLDFILTQESYRGLFGLDMIVDEDGNLFIIEMNARQQMTVAFDSRFQLASGMVPISLLHLAEFLNLDFDLNVDKYNAQSTLPTKAGQLYLRNSHTSDFAIHKKIIPGEYSLTENGELEFVDGEMFIDRKTKDNFILLAKPVGRVVGDNEEIARLQWFENSNIRDERDLLPILLKLKSQ